MRLRFRTRRLGTRPLELLPLFLSCQMHCDQIMTQQVLEGNTDLTPPLLPVFRFLFCLPGPGWTDPVLCCLRGIPR